MAERKGSDLRRLLVSAERLSEVAIARADSFVKMPSSRSSALLVRMTSADQRAPPLPADEGARALPRRLPCRDLDGLESLRRGMLDSITEG